MIAVSNRITIERTKCYQRKCLYERTISAFYAVFPTEIADNTFSPIIMRLATCSFIQENHHVVLKGATGAGKSYIANALAIAACRKLYKVRYVRLPDLLNEFAVAKTLNTTGKFKTAYAKFDLLIIDEWLMRPLNESESYDLLEIIEVCSKKGSIIICTQYDTDEWYYRIDCNRSEDEGSAVAEGILDRIIHNKYSIHVKGRISMRKRHAFSESVESEVNINE